MTPREANADLLAEIAALRDRLASLTRESAERQEALTQAGHRETATSEILRVISSSPTDVQPVFNAIAQSATRLCEAARTLVCTFDGELIRLAAYHNATPEALESARAQLFPLRPRRDLPFARAILNGALVHVPDVDLEPGPTPDFLRQARVRSALCAPLLRDGHAIGVIAVSRSEPRPFSDGEIALLETFADQAVIAIENVRLFTELHGKNRALTQAHAQVTETLEQQMATAEILLVISSSPTDVTPVFRTILANANRLCDASFSVLWLWYGDALTAVAHENVSPSLAELLRTARLRPHRRNPLGLSMLEQTVVHVEDILTDSRFAPEDVPTYRLEGARSIMSVPMVREGNLVGVINAWRKEPRAFTDNQIALLKTFKSVCAWRRSTRRRLTPENVGPTARRSPSRRSRTILTPRECPNCPRSTSYRSSRVRATMKRITQLPHDLPDHISTIVRSRSTDAHWSLRDPACGTARNVPGGLRAD